MNLSDYFDEEEKKRLAELKPLQPLSPEKLAAYEEGLDIPAESEEDSDDEESEED